MGASHSGEVGSHENPHSAKLRSYKRSMDKCRKLQAKKAITRPTQKWKSHLISLLSTPESSSIAYWNLFQKPLIKYIELKSENNVSWLADLQSTSLGYVTYQSQQVTREEAPVLDIDKYERGEMVMSEVEPSTIVPVMVRSVSKFEGTGHNLSVFARPPFNKSCVNMSPEESILSRARSGYISPKAMAASRFMSVVQTERSVKQDLKENLSNQINNPTHIIYRLIKEFEKTFESVFGSLLSKVDQEGASQDDEFAVCSIQALIKHFMNILREFTIWIYEDLIKRLAMGLDQEDVNAGLVIEGLLFELLLGDASCSTTKLTNWAMKMKNREDFDKFKKVQEMMKDDELKSYDECLQKSIFMLEGSKNPYEKAVNKLREIQTKTNPYKKYELILTLEEDLLASVCEHYEGNYDVIQKLRSDFSMDVKIPILVYCVVQSQCESLMLDKLLVEQLVSADYLDTTPAFSMFASCIDYLLYEVGGGGGRDEE